MIELEPVSAEVPTREAGSVQQRTDAKVELAEQAAAGAAHFNAPQSSAANGDRVMVDHVAKLLTRNTRKACGAAFDN